MVFIFWKPHKTSGFRMVGCHFEFTIPQPDVFVLFGILNPKRQPFWSVLLQVFAWHSKTRPFHNQTHFDHLKSGFHIPTVCGFKEEKLCDNLDIFLKYDLNSGNTPVHESNVRYWDLMCIKKYNLFPQYFSIFTSVSHEEFCDVLAFINFVSSNLCW